MSAVTQADGHATSRQGILGESASSRVAIMHLLVNEPYKEVEIAPEDIRPMNRFLRDRGPSTIILASGRAIHAD